MCIAIFEHKHRDLDYSTCAFRPETEAGRSWPAIGRTLVPPTNGSAATDPGKYLGNSSGGIK